MNSSGGGGGGGLSKLGTALVIIFAIALLALFAQLFYALWRRRVFRRQANTSVTAGGDEISHYSSSDSTLSATVSSKELLYFLCVRPQFRFDPNSLPANSNDLNSNNQSDVEVIDIDLLKIQGMFGPPRFLFTVKEEEREGLESPARMTLDPAAEKETKRNVDDEINRGGVSLKEYLQSAEDSVVAVEIDDRGGVDDATPFSTPCASPVYFTPTASPVHDVVNGRSTEESFNVNVAA